MEGIHKLFYEPKMKKLTKEEYKRWTSYKKQGGSNISRCKVNQLNHSIANSIVHEVAKFLTLYHLQSEDHKLITEAVENRTGVRRDLVDLTTGEVYEFEMDEIRSERHNPKEVNIHMVTYDSVIDDLWRMQ